MVTLVNLKVFVILANLAALSNSVDLKLVVLVVNVIVAMCT